MSDELRYPSRSTDPAPPPQRRFALSVSNAGWALGTVIAVLIWAIAAWSSHDDGPGLRFTWWNLALAVPFVLAGGWGFAALYERVPRRPNPRLRGLVSVLIWFVLVAILRRLYVSVLAPVTSLGTTERLILAAALAALLLGFARRTGLGKWSTRIAIFVIVSAFVGSDDISSGPEAVTSAAGPSDITRAQRGAAPRVLLGDASSDPTLQAAPSGGHCERASVLDTRRTMLGFVDRTIRARVQVCWDGNGTPTSVTTHDRAMGGRGRAFPRRITLVGSDPFALAGPSNRELQQPESRQYVPAGAKAGSLLGDEGEAPDDGDPKDDTVVMRADRSGRKIDVVVAWELRDPLARKRWADASVPTSSTDDPVQVYVPRPLPGVTIDAFVVSFDRDGDPTARLVRLGAHGQRDLALMPSDVRPHLVGTEPVLDLIGGR